MKMQAKKCNVQELAVNIKILGKFQNEFRIGTSIDSLFMLAQCAELPKAENLPLFLISFGHQWCIQRKKEAPLEYNEGRRGD